VALDWERRPDFDPSAAFQPFCRSAPRLPRFQEIGGMVPRDDDFVRLFRRPRISFSVTTFMFAARGARPILLGMSSPPADLPWIRSATVFRAQGKPSSWSLSPSPLPTRRASDGPLGNLVNSPCPGNSRMADKEQLFSAPAPTDPENRCSAFLVEGPDHMTSAAKIFH